MSKALIDFWKYIKAIKNRELIHVEISTTERCNSRCKTCGIWRKKSPQDMPLEMFEGILDSIDCKRTFLALLGGEPLLHPNIERILELLKRKDCKYRLITNGILSEKLLYLVRKYKTPEVIVSCDGPRETYKRVRGVDNYENIVQLLGKLKDITRVQINYVVSPWNNRDDLMEVAKLSKQFGAILSVELYDLVEYFEPTAPRMQETYKADDFAPFPRNKYLRLYNKWAKGELSLPCYTIRFSCFIIPNGTVCLCSRKLLPLGSLREQSLREIWHSEKTRKLQDELTYNCNECWGTCYRSADVGIVSIVPTFLLMPFLSR